MRESTIQGIDVEVAATGWERDVHILQFRFRPADGPCFTYEFCVSKATLASRNGYRAGAAAFFIEARRQAEKHLSLGRFEDLVIVRHLFGWALSVAPVDTLPKHTALTDHGPAPHATTPA